MTTWRCSLLAAALALGACAEGEGFFGSAPEPLRAADLDGGAVQLVAPVGYCIDPLALRARFALMARCDTLGDEAVGLGLPLALVTVSLAPGAPPDAPAPGNAEVLGRSDRGPVSLLHLRGTPMEPGFSGVHWRGAGQLEDYAVGLAAYGPEGGPIEGDAGAELLVEVMRSLRAVAAIKAVAAPGAEVPADVPPPPRRPENGLFASLAGLFD